MEITKDININTENLVKESNIIINYSGKLKNSNKIFIHYGYSSNTFEYEKAELNNNKSILIHLLKPGYFYFYFSNENNELDNNDYKDYQLYIKQSNLILTDNSSMKELPYRYILDTENTMQKTFYTKQTIKNTSKPQEIIIPRAFNVQTPTAETKNINGYIIEPVKPIVNYNMSQTLIPTEQLSLVPTKSNYSLRRFNLSIKKLLLAIPKLFGKNYS